MKFDSLLPSMYVYDVHTYRMGNTTMRSVGVWTIHIISIDTVKQQVVASWNGNTPKTFYARDVAKWRKNKPMMISTVMGGQRLATREEIKAAKAKVTKAAA